MRIWILSAAFAALFAPAAHAAFLTVDLLREAVPAEAKVNVRERLQLKYRSDAQMLEYFSTLDRVAGDWAASLRQLETGKGDALRYGSQPCDLTRRWYPPEFQEPWVKETLFFTENGSLVGSKDVGSANFAVPVLGLFVGFVTQVDSHAPSVLVPIGMGCGTHAIAASYKIVARTVRALRSRNRRADLENYFFEALRRNGAELPEGDPASYLRNVALHGVTYARILTSRQATFGEVARFGSALRRLTASPGVPERYSPFLSALVTRAETVSRFQSKEKAFTELVEIKRDFEAVVKDFKLEFQGVRNLREVVDPLPEARPLTAGSVIHAGVNNSVHRALTDAVRATMDDSGAGSGIERALEDLASRGGEIALRIGKFQLKVLSSRDASISRVKLELEAEIKQGNAIHLHPISLEWNTAERTAVEILEADRAQWVPAVLEQLSAQLGCAGSLIAVSPIGGNSGAVVDGPKVKIQR